MFLKVVESWLVVLLVLFLFWQAVFPLLRGTPMFPLFRKGNKEEELQSDLDAAKEELLEEQLKQEAEKVREEVNTLKNVKKGNSAV